MKKYSEIEKKYNEKQLLWKTSIRLEPNKWKRFWKWVWFFIAFPWVWLFYNIRDWHSLVCVIISFALWSSSVWGFYLASALCGWTSTTAGAWLFGIGNAVWVWWLSPLGSPFILFVSITAIGIKALFNKIKHKKEKKIVEIDKYQKYDPEYNPEYIDKNL